jgi:hypothetical protein
VDVEKHGTFDSEDPTLTFADLFCTPPPTATKLFYIYFCFDDNIDCSVFLSLRRKKLLLVVLFAKSLLAHCKYFRYVYRDLL